MDQPVSFEAGSATTLSSSLQDKFLTKIVEKAKELNSNGVTRGDQEILNHRLNFSWTNEKPDSKKGAATLWRNTRARRAYAEIQDANNDLFLAVLLVIPPTECSKTNFDSVLNRLKRLENYEPYRLNLSPAAKRYFESTAAEQGFACSRRYLSFLQALFPPSTGDVVAQPRKRKRVTSSNETEKEPTVTSEFSQNNPKLSNAQEEVIENASLQGIAKVFDEYMCGAIRRVGVQNDFKAAVTTVLPLWGGPVDCLISLDVCEREVEQLAMALFNAKVKWVEQVLHVVLKEGITLIIPNSEATLKGVLDEVIIKVFGPEIHDAITESPIRRRELEEGKHVTECVSMILTKNGAIINLSLGLEGGLQIQNKLYT